MRKFVLFNNGERIRFVNSYLHGENVPEMTDSTHKKKKKNIVKRTEIVSGIFLNEIKL